MAFKERDTSPPTCTQGSTGLAGAIGRRCTVKGRLGAAQRARCRGIGRCILKGTIRSWGSSLQRSAPLSKKCTVARARWRRGRCRSTPVAPARHAALHRISANPGGSDSPRFLEISKSAPHVLCLTLAGAGPQLPAAVASAARPPHVLPVSFSPASPLNSTKSAWLYCCRAPSRTRGPISGRPNERKAGAPRRPSGALWC